MKHRLALLRAYFRGYGDGVRAERSRIWEAAQRLPISMFGAEPLIRLRALHKAINRDDR